MANAIAFISWGMWVADCPQPTCHNARQIFPGDATFRCDNPPDGCGQSASITWPKNANEEAREVSTLPPAEQSTTVPGSPQEDAPDTSGDTSPEDPIPQDAPGDPEPEPDPEEEP